MVCGHATTIATTYATHAVYTTTVPPDRTVTPAEVATTNQVIVDGIRDLENIGGITVVILEVTPVI